MKKNTVLFTGLLALVSSAANAQECSLIEKALQGDGSLTVVDTASFVAMDSQSDTLAQKTEDFFGHYSADFSRSGRFRRGPK